MYTLNTLHSSSATTIIQYVQTVNCANAVPVQSHRIIHRYQVDDANSASLYGVARVNILIYVQLL